MRKIVLLCALLLIAIGAWAKSRDLRLLIFDPPRYPFLAVADNVQGIVHLRLTVGESGKVRAAEVVSGHPALRESAIAAAKKMIFACDHCQADTNIVRHFNIKYEIKGKPTEERRERVRRGRGDDLIIVTITPLPADARTPR